jgi:hypothetical protein
MAQSSRIFASAVTGSHRGKSYLGRRVRPEWFYTMYAVGKSRPLKYNERKSKKDSRS